MAEAYELKTVAYNLRLTEEEAIQLKTLFQNPIVNIQTEFAEFRKFREAVWNALNDAGVK